MEIAQLKWFAASLARRLSWGTIAALVALTGSLAIALGYLYPHDLQTRQLELANAASRHSDAVAQQQSVPQTPATQLHRFYALLPTVRDIPDVLARITGDAAAQSVALSEGQFKLTFDADSQLGRYQIILPVKAGYAATREFVRAALKDTPALALQELSFERSDPNAAIANVRVQFVLYVLPAPVVAQ